MSQSTDQRQISSKLIRRALHDMQAPARHTRSFLEMFRESIDESTLSAEALEMLDAATRSADELRDYFVAIRSVLAVPVSIEARTKVELAVAAELAWASVENRKVEEFATGETQFDIQGSASIESEELLVVEMLTELLDNAEQFRKLGNLHVIRCQIEPLDDSAEVRVEIIDNGIGIDPQSIDDLMQPFHHGHDVHGIGLGLTRCECIAKTVGATIQIQSDGESGTKAIVSFPCGGESS